MLLPYTCMWPDKFLLTSTVMLDSSNLSSVSYSEFLVHVHVLLNSKPFPSVIYYQLFWTCTILNYCTLFLLRLQLLVVTCKWSKEFIFYYNNCCFVQASPVSLFLFTICCPKGGILLSFIYYFRTLPCCYNQEDSCWPHQGSWSMGNKRNRCSGISKSNAASHRESGTCNQSNESRRCF